MDNNADLPESLCRAVFAHSMEAVLITSPEGHVIAANSAACKLFGYSEKQLCNLNREKLVDISSSQSRLNEFLAKRAETGNARAELVYIRGDGSRFLAEASSQQFTDEQGDIRTILTVHR